jgi:hypothetical protein
MSRRKASTLTEEPDRDLLDHIQGLSLGTVEEYRDWCARYGFSQKLVKHWRLRLKERAYATQAAADARLAQKKKELRRPESVIEQIFQGKLPESSVTQPHLEALCRAYKSSKSCRHTKQHTLRLLLHVCKTTDLLSSEPVIAEFGWQEGNSFVAALVAMARLWTGWIRPVEEWRPRTHNTRRQFSSLARHLFTRWPVPRFMDSVWFKGHAQGAARQQRWFLHLGKGENIRHADLPIPYTKRMAHQFMQAPSDLGVEGALRWGQIHALGGCERLVRATVGSRLGSRFENDDFWSSMLRWFVDHPMLDPAQISPLVDYVHHQKYVGQDVFVAPGVMERQAPPQPNFTMKGRSPESLLRQVEEWHRRLGNTEQPPAEWRQCGIRELEFLEGNERSGNLKIWTIKELLSTKALFAEGRRMKHCVATYSRSCAAGACSIWTLEVESFEGKRKLLTVEVNNTAKLICQARGKYNALPGDKHRGILRRWAAQAGLQLASHV